MFDAREKLAKPGECGVCISNSLVLFYIYASLASTEKGEDPDTFKPRHVDEASHSSTTLLLRHLQRATRMVRFQSDTKSLGDPQFHICFRPWKSAPVPFFVINTNFLTHHYGLYPHTAKGMSPINVCEVVLVTASRISSYLDLGM